VKRLIIGAALAALLAVPGFAPVSAAAPYPLRSSLAEAVAAQAQLGRALSQNASQRETVRRQLEATDARLGELDASITAREAQIAALRARIASERSAVGSLARAIDEEPPGVLSRLARARSLGELLTSMAELTAAGRRGDALAAALEADRAKLEERQAEDRAERERQAEMRASQQADLDRLRQLMVEESRVATALAASIRRTRTALAGGGPTDPAELARLEQQLLADQAALIAAAQLAAWDQAALWMEANPDAMASLGPAKAPALSWPVPGAPITQPFGPTDLTIEPPYGGYPHFHTGLDLGAEQGTPALAADDAMVAASDSSPTGYGTYVVLAHAGGLTTLYGHLLQPLVGVGQRVSRGQPIGLVGSTGNSTGPHLHFEVRLADKPVDPQPLLR
jgi:murein DD-endopeptidase MepM/ murein hydrolase activator NlpD